MPSNYPGCPAFSGFILSAGRDHVGDNIAETGSDLLDAARRCFRDPNCRSFTKTHLKSQAGITGPINETNCLWEKSTW